MLLTIDIGNTHNKLMLWNGNESKLISEINYNDFSHLDQIASITGPTPTWLLPKILRPKDYLKSNFLFSMPIHYSSTVGEDRLVQSYYIFMTQQRPCLFIDAGTYITINYIDENGFQGGPISPGVKKITEIFSQGNNLYTPNAEKDPTWSWPHGTEDAMFQGLSMSIRGLCQQADLINSHCNIIVSGGSAEFVLKLLKGSAQEKRAIHFPQLIQHSLKYFYEQLKLKDFA